MLTSKEQAANMIKLLNDVCQVLKIVNTDDQLFRYLQENCQTLNEQAQKNWQFIQHPHKRLATLLKEMEEKSLIQKSFVHMTWQACQQESDMIVICTGDGENPDLFLVMPGLDIAALKREWCKLFCAAHNLHIRIG
jgi:hypothetical protein